MCLDISTERHLARAGIPAAKARLDDLAQYLNGLFATSIGRPSFRAGSHSDDVYSAIFSTEEDAKQAMACASQDLSAMRLTYRRSGVTLTGLMGRVS